MAAGEWKIVGIGEILWDVFPSGKRLGGAPANFIYHVGELGGAAVRATVVSRVGEDGPGREILGRWNSLSLSEEFLTVDPKHPTGTVSVTVDPQGKPAFDIQRGVAWDFLPESPALRELAATADAVCFGTLAQRAPASRKTIQSILRHTSSEALRILDLNLRVPFFVRSVVEESLSLSNVVKMNSEELRILAGYYANSGAEEAVVAELMRRFPLRLVVLTKGDQGSVLFTRQGRSAHGGFRVPVADTVGAGDAFCAAIALGMLAGFPPGKLNECANRAAAFVCTRPGAMPETPEEIKMLFRG